VLQAQEFVPGPVDVHVAFGSQSPWVVAQASTGAHDRPSPPYPVWHTQETSAALVDAHVALGAQPPLPTSHVGVVEASAPPAASALGATSADVSTARRASVVPASTAYCP